jgi:hypothetical protein
MIREYFQRTQSSLADFSRKGFWISVVYRIINGDGRKGPLLGFQECSQITPQNRATMQL